MNYSITQPQESVTIELAARQNEEARPEPAFASSRVRNTSEGICTMRNIGTLAYMGLIAAVGSAAGVIVGELSGLGTELTFPFTGGMLGFILSGMYQTFTGSNSTYESEAYEEVHFSRAPVITIESVEALLPPLPNYEEIVAETTFNDPPPYYSSQNSLHPAVVLSSDEPD